MRHKESEIQRQCVAWFRLQYRDLAPLLFSCPNGMLTSQTQARIAVAEGLTRGVSDLLLLLPRCGFHGLCIEMKQVTEEWKQGKRTLRKGRQSTEQKAWQSAVEGQGYAYAVCWSFEDFMQLINSYLDGTFTR